MHEFRGHVTPVSHRVTKMASRSARYFLSDEELSVAVNSVESEDEYSDFGNFDSEYHPSDNEDTGSAVIDETAPQPSRKKSPQSIIVSVA
jgi:hypothetical protein